MRLCIRMALGGAAVVRLCGAANRRNPAQRRFFATTAGKPVTEMTVSLAAEQQPPSPCVGAPLAWRSPASNGVSAASARDADVSVDKWCLLAAQARAMPGFMMLAAVHQRGQIVDFVWDFASAAAGRLLCQTPSRMLGRALVDVLGETLGPASVLELYRHVVESTTARVGDHFHVINGVEDLFRHRAVRLGDGVAVTLTNLSAAARAQTLRQAMVLNGTARW
jgi:PAS fold